MKILSIDTSSKICGVAVLEANLEKEEVKGKEKIEILKEIEQDNGLTHSETLMPIIKENLENINLKLKDIDLIICDKGPGSFTGIRIGVATAKAFEDALGIKTIGISSLEALAYNCEEDATMCSLIDAKNDSAYWAIFEKRQGKCYLKSEYKANDIKTILENLPDETTFVGDGAVAYQKQIFEQIPSAKFSKINKLSAVNLGIAGIQHFKENEECVKEELLPLYIRKPQAERMLGNKDE